MTEWHQLVPMSGHVEEPETAKQNSTILLDDFQVYIRVNSTIYQHNGNEVVSCPFILLSLIVGTVDYQNRMQKVTYLKQLGENLPTWDVLGTYASNFIQMALFFFLNNRICFHFILETSGITCFTRLQFSEIWGQQNTFIPTNCTTTLVPFFGS